MKQLHTTLVRANLRLTQPRRRVFEYLQKSGAVTIAEVLMAVNEVDRASVYRTLSLFRSIGVIEDIVAGGKRKIELTDRFGEHHHHLFCENCGITLVANDSNLETKIENLATSHGFLLASHQLEISGLCADCQAAKV